MYQIEIPFSITRPLDTAKRQIDALIVARAVHGDGVAFILFGSTKGSSYVPCEDGRKVFTSSWLVCQGPGGIQTHKLLSDVPHQRFR